jgi:hypothetical protein
MYRPAQAAATNVATATAVDGHPWGTSSISWLPNTTMPMTATMVTT